MTDSKKPIDLHAIANTPGYGSGQAARDAHMERSRRKAELPDPADMWPLSVGHEIDALVCSFGFDWEDEKDYHINATGYDGQTLCDGSSAGRDARILAALWNSYMAGDLVWVGAQ